MSTHSTQGESDAAGEEHKDLCQQAESYLSGWKRAQADYENLKRESARQLTNTRRLVLEGMLLEMLPILDNIQLALRHAPAEPKEWVDGIRHIERHFTDAFLQWGVEPVEAAGRPFDPACMEAVGAVPGAEEGVVAEVAQAGYRVGEDCLRPAKVIVTRLEL